MGRSQTKHFFSGSTFMFDSHLYQISSELRVLPDQTDRSQEPVAVDMNGEHIHGFDLAKQHCYPPSGREILEHSFDS